jgi:DNA polymerase III alpha subunit
MGRGEVDALRQALHRGHGPAVPPGLQGELLARCAAHGTPEAEARSLWAQVLTFRGISYGKAHALVSARLGLACAWLREHRPADLLAALLAHGGGYYPRAAYLHEARRAGLGLLGPSVSESGLRWQGAGPAALRAGLRDVRGLTARAAEAIVAARQEGGTYRSEADLARRARLAPRDLDALHRAGALPGGEAAGAPERRRDRLRQELEGVGHLLSAHPLDLVADRLPAGLVRAQDLPGYAGAAVGVAGWLLTLKPVRDRAGRPMSFATFDDTTGLFDAVLQGQIHARHAPRLLGSPGPWLVCGRVALDPAAAAVRLDDLVEVAPDAQLCPSIRRFEDVRM